MTAEIERSDYRLPVPATRSVERAVFSLDMGPDGVRLRIGSALFQDYLVLRDLVLSAVAVRYPFDYTAGPRALQSHLTRLEQVTVEIGLEGLSDRLRHQARPGWTLDGIRGIREGLVVSGTVEDVPYSLRIRLEPASGGSDVRLRFAEPRVWGSISRSWDCIPALLTSLVPPSVRGSSGESHVDIHLLRPVLRGLTAGLGFKIPFLDGARLVGTEIKDHGIALHFQTRRLQVDPDVPGDLPAGPFIDHGDPETTARQALESLDQGDRSPDTWGRFLLAGVAVPRLAPEVLARASALGEERPESVLPHLVGIVVAAASPNLVNPRDFTVLARRLLASVEAEGNKADLGRAARLVASLSMSLDPAVSLEILEGVRMLGVEDEVVLEATALSLDRIGRPDDAVLLRVRALSRVPAGRTGELLRGMVRRLDAAGLGSGASAWLEEVLVQCRQGRFGSESRSIGWEASVLLATRESVLPENGERARERLREILRDNPAHSEALDLLVAIASGPREGAEAVTRLRAAAEAGQGDSRARFLLDAAQVTLERLGLRRQAIELLEAALESSPGNEHVASTLDGLYRELGHDDRRLALMQSRLAWTTDPVLRSSRLLDIGMLAEDLGDLSLAGQALGEVLQDDPTHRAALVAACRVHAATGDSESLDRVVSSLLDLDPDAIPIGLRPAGIARRPVVRDAARAHDIPEQPGLEPDPEDIDAFELESRHIREVIDSARQALDQGDAPRALTLSSQILEIDPDHVVALRLAMQAAAADGQIRAAVALGRRWSDRLYSTAERTSALLELSDLCALDPTDPTGPGSILALAASGDPSDTRILEAARRRVAEDPAEVERTLLPTVTAISHAALDLEAPARTLVAVRIHEAALFTWDEIGDLESSVALLEVALGLDPDDASLRSDLASLYEATGRLDAAQALLQANRIV